MKFIKENLRLVIAIIIAVILIIIGVVLINTNEEKTPSGDNPVVEQQQSREELIEEATGMTGDDAILIVKENFGSDNYEFTSEVTEEGLYKVTVTNTVEESTFIYYVDPTNGVSYIDMGAQ